MFLISGPSWFVSTIWFYYWIFPSLLPRLQRYTAQQKQKWLIGHFVIQLLIPIVFIVGGTLISEEMGVLGFGISYVWPPAVCSFTVFSVSRVASLACQFMQNFARFCVITISSICKMYIPHRDCLNLSWECLLGCFVMKVSQCDLVTPVGLQNSGPSAATSWALCGWSFLW